MTLPTKEKIREFFEECYFQLSEKFKLSKEDFKNYKPKLKFTNLYETLEKVGLSGRILKKFKESSKYDFDDPEIISILVKIDKELNPHYDPEYNLISLYYPVDISIEKGLLNYFDYSKKQIFRIIAGEIGHALRAIAQRYVFTDKNSDILYLDLESLKCVRDKKEDFPFINISEFFDGLAQILSFEIFQGTSFAHSKPDFPKFVYSMEDAFKGVLKKSKRVKLINIIDNFQKIMDFTTHLPYFAAICLYETDRDKFKKLIENSELPLIYQAPESIYRKHIREYLEPL